MTSSTTNDLLTAALRYAEMGIPVFPLQERGKKPIVPGGFKSASIDPDQIRAWWSQNPAANIGIPTGGSSGFAVLDIDPRHGGGESLASLLDRFGNDDIETPMVHTGGDGTHFYFRHPDDESVPCRTHLAGFRGVDLKASGGYVVAPPSIHESGGRYEWDRNDPWDLERARKLPTWVTDLANQGPDLHRKDYVADTWDGSLPPAVHETLARSPKVKSRFSRSHDGLTDQSDSGIDFSLACQLAVNGHSGSDIEAAVRASRREAGLPHRPESYFASTIGKALTLQETDSLAQEGLTDTGNARRLERLHGADLRFSHSLGRWFVWNGCRWSEDTSGEIMRRAKTVSADLFREASEELDDDDARRRIAKFGFASQSERSLKAMISLARSEGRVPVDHEDFDADPLLLNTPRGIVDLTAGKLLPHDRAAMCSKVTGGGFDPDARSELWESCLETWLPDPSVREFMQRAVGLSLIGEIREHIVILMLGVGANGKSVFIEAVRHALGDYAMQTPTETLITNRDTGIPNDVARLRGARFVSASESEENKRLSEAKIKSMTGGDRLTARHMRGEWFDFQPQFTLFIGTNHRPTIRGTDDGIWRRIALVPFDIQIPEDQRDPELPRKLRTEAEGILSWAVEGTRKYLETGLQIPGAVRARTAEYRDEEDVIGQFIEDQCELSESAEIPVKRLYEAFCDWAGLNHERACTKNEFSRRLKARGFKGDRTSAARIWLGIRLLPDCYVDDFLEQQLKK